MARPRGYLSATHLKLEVVFQGNLTFILYMYIKHRHASENKSISQFASIDFHDPILFLISLKMSPSRLDPPLPDAPADGFPSKLAADSRAAIIDAFNASTVTSSDVVASLIKNGGCIIRNILDAPTLDAIEADVRPWILKDQPWTGDFFPPETRRVMGLAEKSKVFTDSIPGNKLYQDVCGDLLTSWHESWHGQKLMKSESKPQLNNTIVFSIAPGAKRQELHRDDMNIHNKLEALASHEEYKIGRDCTIGFLCVVT